MHNQAHSSPGHGTAFGMVMGRTFLLGLGCSMERNWPLLRPPCLTAGWEVSRLVSSLLRPAPWR